MVEENKLMLQYREYNVADAYMHVLIHEKFLTTLWLNAIFVFDVVMWTVDLARKNKNSFWV